MCENLSLEPTNRKGVYSFFSWKKNLVHLSSLTKTLRMALWIFVELYRCLLWMKHFLFSRSLVRLLGKRKEKIIKLSSEKNRFKAATFSQFCLYLITFISDLIPHTDLWSQDFFARYYENFSANANPSFRKLPMKLPWRLRKILVHVNMSFGKLSTRIRKLSRYVFVHVNMSFGKLSTRIRKLSRYIFVHVNMSFGKLSTRIRKLSRYILVHVN